MNSFEIVRTVRLTEKGTRQGEKYNQYTVVADPAGEQDPDPRRRCRSCSRSRSCKVNTLNVRGKFRRQRRHDAGQSSNWKKAIVTLKEGDKIRPDVGEATSYDSAEAR